MSYRKAVKLTALIVKKDDLSEDEFRQHFVEHGKKAVPKLLKHGLLEYTQVSEKIHLPTFITQKTVAYSYPTHARQTLELQSLPPLSFS